MFPDAGRRWLRLFALDPTDLVLSKLERGAEHDRSDLLALATRRVSCDLVILARYVERLLTASQASTVSR